MKETFRATLIMAFAAVLIATCHAEGQVILADNYNVAGAGSGFALNTGVNTGINPPSTRLTGVAAAGLRYINTGDKADTAYSITANQLNVSAATNSGRFILSADGVSPFNFAPALGTAAATPAKPANYDVTVRMNNNSAANQRFSIALGTADGDVDTWDFGVQIYRASGSDNFYTIGKRVDTGSSGLANDLNKPITTLTGNTFGNDITVLMRVTDAGAESSGFHSRVRLSLNGGNTWFYDSDTDADLPNGWRLEGAGRHIIWHIAANAGPVTFDAFSLSLNPPASNLNTSSIFRVITYNIHFGVNDGKVNTQNIANFILNHRADLVALNEVDRYRDRSANRDLIGELARETGMNYVYSNNIPSLAGNDESGNAILSKYPILFRDHRLLPRLGDHEQRGLLKAVVDVNGKFLSFWATHLDFRDDDTERLMCVTNFNTWVAEETLPVIICGDFNETPGKPFHDRMEQKWEDVWLLAGDGTLGRTVPCPGPAQARIDYIWKVKGANLLPINASVPNIESSDHYPVQSQFVLADLTNHVGGFYFPFNEGGGSSVTDAVGGLSGKFGAGAPSWSPDDPSGSEEGFSLYFDGTKKLTVADPKQIIGTNGVDGDYTLQAWVKLPLNYAPAKRAILFQYERRPGFSFSVETNRTLHTTTFKIKDISSAAAIPNDGKWHHVAVVHNDGASMSFFIDGALASTVPYTNGVGYRTSSLITIGSASENANPFTGFLTKIRFDSRALAAAELDYSATPNSAPVASSQLVTASGDSSTGLFLQASDADGDPLSYQIKSLPINGLISQFDATNGTVAYLPARGFRGPDRITFVANDPFTNSPIATINLTVVSPADTNANGLADSWEALHGTSDPGADPDGDGQDNLAEYRANTDPKNAASFLRFLDAGWQTNGHFGFSWSSVGGTRYRIQYSDGAPGGGGTNLYTDLLRPLSAEMDASPVGQSTTQSFNDPFTYLGDTSQSGRYYRIKVAP